MLQYAKEVLCDPEKRSNYDKWRNSGIKISYKQWLGMKEHVQQVSYHNIQSIQLTSRINDHPKTMDYIMFTVTCAFLLCETKKRKIYYAQHIFLHLNLYQRSISLS